MQIPLDRLLLETDAPDGRPRLDEPYQQRLHSLADDPDPNEQNRANHPANIRYSKSCMRLHIKASKHACYLGTCSR